MIFTLMSVVFGLLAIIFTMSALTFPSKENSNALLGKANSKQIIAGNMDEDFKSGAHENQKHGFEVKVDRMGKVTFLPNSTISNHAMRKALES